MRTLPLVFINLGGEMLYILDQRLHAHSTSEDKSEKGRLKTFASCGQFFTLGAVIIYGRCF